ncbi:helix-turn-helix domain-containing protein [Vibrio splendidus]|uniref:helix-turn-helix domain-containing protein n=1 Tax=Vibrio splendidus TaxID=29497 RepID=UPI0002E46F46|nr:helix-turn-helix transcriptional regulator [Vibrio splendidus]MDH5975182.1 helix-turn-helix transcriptional regulator [Vibrio splendidus]OEF67297.1 transcriptional regulator [Vibrio splendidus 1F-157]
MNMTKEESIRWINHAIAFYESLGKKQKELAEDFGIKESRISELKNAKKPLKVSPNQIRQIIELCGAPKRDPGRFEHVELYDSLELFFEQYIPVTFNRFHCDVYQYMSNIRVIEQLIDKCSFESESRTEKIRSINQLVRSEGFAEICKDVGFNDKVTGSSINQFSSITEPYGVSISNKDTFHILRQLWSLIDVLPEFQFGRETNCGLDVLVPKTPVVVTGNRIAAFMPEHSMHDGPANELVEKELIRLISDYLPSIRDLPKLDNWNTIRVEVYLSENMNYHLLIHMSQGNLEPLDLSHESTIPEGFEWCNYDAAVGERDRIALIKNVNTLDLFRQIEELRKWQGLEQDNLYELKQNIAKAGGHIPGAYVLV